MLVKSQVKYIQSLSQKKHREEEGVFIAEGPRILDELLNECPSAIKQIFATIDWIEKNAIPETVELIEVDAPGLERISQLATPNKVLAVVQQFAKPRDFPIRDQITIVLDSLQDPGNFGTIIRTADWFGISQVVCNPACADIYNPKVVQATMGSITRVGVFYTNIEEWLAEKSDIKIYGTALQGKPVSEVGKIKEGILIIGNEAKGIHQNILQLANEIITIPKKGKADSLNAAIAAGILLSHIC